MKPKDRGDDGYSFLREFPLEPEASPSASFEPERVLPCADGLVGRTPGLEEVRRLIVAHAAHDAPVVLVGETGTGKELVARALHRRSLRASRPFEALNCAAIPKDLAESELFGHAQGAFTGAMKSFSGVFERAHRGTLFLDEVGEMPIELQPKLLRVLETGRVRRVGAERAIPVDVRVIAATHRSFSEEIRAGRFRRDLYHRLALGVIDIPPLRARPADIIALAHYFCRKSRVQRRESTRIAPDAYRALTNYSWPGNIRELKNVIERALLTGHDPIVRADLSFLLQPNITGANEAMIRYQGRSFADLRREIYHRALKDCGGNRAAAAAVLSIPKSTFFDHLRAMEREG